MSIRRMNFVSATILATLPTIAGAGTYYLSPSGNDGNPGTLSQPWRSASKCANLVAGDVCVLRAGVYRGQITIANSGTASQPIVWKAYNGEKVEIDNRVRLQNWVRYSGDTWVNHLKLYDLTTQAARTDIFVRGGRIWKWDVPLPESRWPDPSNLSAYPLQWPWAKAGAGSSGLTLNTIGAPPVNLAGARVQLMRGWELTGETFTVLSGTGGGNLALQGSPIAGQFLQQNNRYAIVGHYNLISRAYEWAYDAATQRVFLRVSAGGNPNDEVLYTDGDPVALRLDGRSYIRIEGITFRGSVPVMNSSSSNLTFENDNILYPGPMDRIENGVTQITAREGFLLRGSHHTISRTSIGQCQGKCLTIASDDSRVENSVIHDGNMLGGIGGGVLFFGSRNIFRSNQVMATGSNAIVHWWASGTQNLVRRNLVRTWGYVSQDAVGILYSETDPGLSGNVDSNVVEGGRRAVGLSVDPKWENSAIRLDATEANLMVRHNIIRDNNGYGITLRGNNTSKRVLGARIWQNTIGPGHDASFVGQFLQGGLANCSFSNSIFTSGLLKWNSVSGNTASIVNWSLPEVGALGAYVGPHLTVGRDPKFVDPASGDLTLQSTSPAINAGVAPQPANGWPFKGAAPDLGALEYGTNFSVGPETINPPPTSVDPLLDFENPTLWHALWTDPATVQLRKDAVHTNGDFSLGVNVDGFKFIESNPISQAKVRALGFLDFDLFVPLNQPNPWWFGQVQVYLDCPSQGVLQRFVGQRDLTGLPLGDWTPVSMPIPSDIASALRGSNYSDLRIRLTLNTPSGSDWHRFDNFHFMP